MSMKWIRDTYGVPAKRGMTVIVLGTKIGKIVSADNHIRVRYRNMGKTVTRPFHPTDNISYLMDNGEWHEACCDSDTKQTMQTVKSKK